MINDEAEKQRQLLVALVELSDQIREHISQYGEMYRRCTNCEKVKPVAEFYRRTNGTLRAECAPCARVREIEKRKLGLKKDIDKKSRTRRKGLPSHKQMRTAWDKIKHLVNTKQIPPARELPCQHCGAQASDYHHHKGYSEAHATDVIALCHTCHRGEHIT